MKYFDKFEGGDVSFWECFSYMKDVPFFKKLYKEDRSKDKNKSSKVMWYLTLYLDLDSDFYSLDVKEKYPVICDTLGLDVKEYLGSQEELSLLEHRFEDFIDTVITADVRSLENKLRERKDFIQETPYSLDAMVYPSEGESFKPYLKKGTADQLDKMMVETKNIHEEIRKLREASRNEQSEQ